MPARIVLVAVLIPAGLGVPAAAQFSPPDSTPSSQAPAQRWRIGMVVTAGGAPCTGIVGTTTVPTDWPEQKVRVAATDVSRGVTVGYKTIDGTVKQMVVKIPRLAAGAEARAVLTLEVARAVPRPPDHTDQLVMPDLKTLEPGVRAYLRPSPYIESTHPTIRALAKEAVAGKDKAWEKVEAIFECVHTKVRYQKDTPPKRTLETLRDGSGDCDELSSLFIALCRANDIPARTVRVPRHVYPEFYLQDKQGAGHWFPCEPSGTRTFRGMPDPKPIMQKGDSFDVETADPATGRPVVKNLRYVPDNLRVSPQCKRAPPQLKLVCEPASN